MLGVDHVIWYGDGRQRTARVRSVRKDKHVRFQPSICHECNTANTQAADLAYDAFSDYVHRNMTRLWRSRYLNFRDLYGDEWEQKRENLARYAAKHFGCRWAEAGLLPPEPLAKFVLQGGNHEGYNFHLIKMQSIRNMGAVGRTGLFLTPQSVDFSRSRRTIIYSTAASFVGYIGIRCEWRIDGWENSSLHHYGRAKINYLLDEREVNYPPMSGQVPKRRLSPERWRVRFAPHH